MSEHRPLRLLVLDEGVLGHRTLTRQLSELFAADPEVEARMVTVPPPGRLGRLLLRRWRRIGDADLMMLRWRLRWSWQARRLLKRHARWADVALIVTQSAGLLSRGPMRRVPCVLSIDATLDQFTALEYEGPRDRFSPLQERLLRRLERRAIAGAAAVIAWTEWNAEALRGEYEVADVHMGTIHPGLDASWWAEGARRPKEQGGPTRILFVGNDVERKGLGLLVAAVERLEFEAVLDVVSGDEVPESPTVNVHRGVEAGSERLRELFAAADLFAFPTRADAVPWVVLEAMASGLPVVASRVGAIEEMLGDAGETIAPGSVEELVAALERLADPDLRERLGELAQARVHERYDNAVQTTRLLDFLREAAGRPSGGGGSRKRRRTFVAAGAGAAGVALAAPYISLLPGEEFEQLVASKLGVDPELAAQLLERAREEYGDGEYDARAAAFAFAVRDPAALVLPDGLRERAISGLIEPMLSSPAASLAYAITGTDPGGTAACAGLVRDR